MFVNLLSKTIVTRTIVHLLAIYVNRQFACSIKYRRRNKTRLLLKRRKQRAARRGNRSYPTKTNCLLIIPVKERDGRCIDERRGYPGEMGAVLQLADE